MAYRYPSSPYVRRHGPRGYRNYRSYKPWLRDEFDFRRVHALTERGAEQIALCRLNRPRLLESRRMMMEMLRLLESSTNEEARELLEFLLGFPDNLPRLSALRPPDGNARSDSVVNSYDEKRRRGELPATY